MKKDETWYLSEGKIRLNWIDTSDASRTSEIVESGSVIRNRPGEPHQVEALTDAIIFEVSTTHFDEDSYRVETGDSQVG
jgi:mannose-6-phosphate isomerase-like protein (cupin superfamily)